MVHRSRARINYDDMVVCHRMGYSSITPQACVEKHIKNEDACGGCRLFRAVAMQLADAIDSTPEHIAELARNGEISRYGNPLVRPESLPDTSVVNVDDTEKGTKTMNTRILFINGRRMPQGVIAEFRPGGGLAERSMVVFFLLSFFTDAKIEAKDIALDEYVNGRLQTRYEWSASDEKTYGKAMTQKTTKNGKELEVLGFRLMPIITDNYTRG